MKLLTQIYNRIGAMYLSPLLKVEQNKRPFPEINERAIEYGFALTYIQALCTGSILDVGSGRSSWPHLLSVCGYDVKAVDKSSRFNRHYNIDHADITHTWISGYYQFITCISTLEHISDHRKAMLNMWMLLEYGGYLILTFPYNERFYHRNIYEHLCAGYGQTADFITQVFSREEINNWLFDTTFEIVAQEYYQVFTGGMWTMGKRIVPGKMTTTDKPHHLTCILLQKK